MYLVTIDPGPSSGVSMLNTNNLTLHTATIAIESIKDVRNIFEVLRQWGIESNGRINIVEDFRLLRGGRLVGDPMMTSRILGVLEWELPNIVWQQPAKQWGFTPRMIRIFRENYTRPVGKHLRLPKITRHEVSAIKHLMYYMRENGYKQMQDVMRYTMEGEVNEDRS